MISTIIDNIRRFRNALFDVFKYRADATLDLIDTIAGEPLKKSVVQLSLSNIFRRQYSSITDVLNNLFRRKANTLPTPEEIKEDQLKVTKLSVKECPREVHRPFALFAVDCSSNPHIYSKTLEDRGFVNKPTKVPGQKPITVGHQYSSLVYLPERMDHSAPHWVVPLSTRRVSSNDSATLIGMEQIAQVVTTTDFKDMLCVLVDDSAYSRAQSLVEIKKYKDLVNIARMRNNRIFNCQPTEKKEKKGKGRPKVYGEKWKLHDPGSADDTITIPWQSAAGKKYQLKIERWNNRLERMKDSNNKDNKEKPGFVFDAVRVTILKPDGTHLYKKPLWLMVTGERRREITLKDIAESYFQRFDIEHFFRFAKQQLLLTAYQTPEVRHEENWWALCMMSYTMLYLCRELADNVRNPWEKKLDQTKSMQIRTASQVQRDYKRIIREIGTSACNVKHRGKSPGRVKGTRIAQRICQPIVKKSEIDPKNKSFVAV